MHRLQYKFNTQVGQLLKTEGGGSQQEAVKITIYYDFDNAMKWPLQLA